jgi:hypothetical protein
MMGSMSSTTPATKLTRRTTVTEHTDLRSAGVTHLHGPSVFAEPADSESFAVVAWDVDRGTGKATAGVATADECELFTGQLLSTVLLEAFEWAEKEASR